MDLDIVQIKDVTSIQIDSTFEESEPEEFKEAVIKDIQEFISTLRGKELFQELRILQKPSIYKSGSTILIDWFFIFLAWWLAGYVSLYFLPLSILIIGNRQRALGNLLHDAGHSALDSIKWRNDLIANLSLSWPLFNLTNRYWDQHRTHHLYLGSMSDDPDFIHKDTFWQTTWQKVLILNVFSWPMWKSSVFGHLLDIAFKDLAMIVLWWVVTLGLMALIAGPYQALLFFGIWILARASVFHFITTFREISDHVGLIPGTLIGFTRNNPTRGLGRIFFHPHQNGYHLTHHLAQRVPFFALPKAHQLFLNCPQYEVGHHCDSYFWGNHSVVDCWTGKCQPELRTS